MSVDLARRLLASGVVQRDDIQRALLIHLRDGLPLLRALLDGGVVSTRALDDELARSEMPQLRAVVALPRLSQSLPAGLCRALLAVPVRLDARTGTIDVAAADPFHRHVEREFAHHLRAPIRLIRAPLASIEEALRKLEQGEVPEPAPAPPPRPSSPPPRHSRRTPPYLSRVEAPLNHAAPGVPQLRRSNSDIPIPLVRRAEGGEGRQSLVPARLFIPPAPALPLVPPGPAAELPEPLPFPEGPFSARAPGGPFPDAGPLLEALRKAQSRDEVIDLLLNGLAMVAGRVGAFVVRKGEFQGFRCNEALGELKAFQAVHIPLDVPSVLATASATGLYLGPIPRTAPHAALLRVMGGEASEIAAAPIRMDSRLVMVLLLDALGDSMLATRRVEEMGRLAGEVLARILQREKQG